MAMEHGAGRLAAHLEAALRHDVPMLVVQPLHLPTKRGRRKLVRFRRGTRSQPNRQLLHRRCRPHLPSAAPLGRLDPAAARKETAHAAPHGPSGAYAGPALPPSPHRPLGQGVDVSPALDAARPVHRGAYPRLLPPLRLGRSDQDASAPRAPATLSFILYTLYYQDASAP